MSAKLNTFDETTKKNVVKKENNSLTINELEPYIYENRYGNGRLNCPVCIVKGIAPKIIEKTTLEALLTKKLRSLEPANIETATNLKTAYESGNKQAYDTLKQKLYGFVIGDFKSRKDADLLTYAPLLCLDIDGYSDQLEASWDLDLLKKNEYVFAAWFSPSTHGLRVLVWTDATPETHKATYSALQAEFCTFLNITTDKDKTPHIDLSTSNVSRLWFISETETVYFNRDSVVFCTPSVVQAAAMQAETMQATATQKPQYNDATLSDTQKLEACAEMVTRRNLDNGRNNFVFRLVCLANEHGVLENAILNYCLDTYKAEDFAADEIKKTVVSGIKRTQHGKFSDAQLLQYLKNSTPSVVTPLSGPTKSKTPGPDKVATPKTESKNPGPDKAATPKTAKPTPSVVATIAPTKTTTQSDDDTDDEDGADDEDVSKFAKLESFLQKSHDIRFNTVSRELEIRRKNKGDFTHLDDFEFNDLLRAISRKNIKVSDKTLAVSLYSSFTPRYNPFQLYLDSLPKWNDTEKDHITELASFVKAKDAYWFKTQFKKALVRTVACAIGKLSFNKHCLVFHGKQNDGKSTFIRQLAPKDLKPYIKENFKVDKDGLISLCQNFIINLDEIDTMNKGDLDQIKALFATDSVKERLPYARTPAKFKRTASFFGSTNKNEFLTDETGNVRWLIIEIDRIDFNYTKLDIDAVWSQAYALLNSGFDYQMTRDEVEESERNNQKFKRVYIELELLQERFEPCEKDHTEAVFMLSSTMLNRITNDTTLKLNVQMFAKALAELGFKKVSKRQERSDGTSVPMNGFYVLEKK